MKIGQRLYVKNRTQWRAWLAKNHQSAPEIWLVYFKKASGKPRIPYNDAVEEALCYGWIDSILKPIDEHSFAQRFSPRRKTSPLSPMNNERIRRLIKAKRMTRCGLASIKHHMNGDESNQSEKLVEFELPQDILKILRRNTIVWKNFRRFPKSYQRIRVGWIDGARKRPDELKKRLRYFIKMTAQNKKFGMVQ